MLAVDLVQTPHPHLPADYWGLPEGTHGGLLNRLPIDALFVLFGQLGAPGLPQKALLLASVFLAGLGAHRLAPVQSLPARVFAGLLYAANPFVYDRLYAGQWFVLLGYALLPWAFASFVRLLRGGRPASAWRFGALGALTGIASPHMAALLALLCLAVAAAFLVARPARRALLSRAAAGGALALLLSIYWLLPTPGLSRFLDQIGRGELDLYQTVADERFGVEATVLGLHGFWNNPNPVRELVPVWPAVALALLVLGLAGLALRRRDPVACGVALAAALGWAIALGTASALTRGPFVALLEHVEIARAFREPQKAVALIALAYAYLGAVAVDDLVRNRTRWTPAPVLVAVVLVLPLVQGYRTLGGLWGKLETSRFPASWNEANTVLKREAGRSRTLFLPWSGYLELEFAHGRLVANPAPRFFETPILASRSVGEGAGVASSSDPVERRVDALLTRGSTFGELGGCFAALGVSHVLLLNSAAADYRFLERRADIVPVRRWRDLTLYRLRRPGALVMSVPAGATPCAKVVPLPSERRSPVRYRAPLPLPGDRALLLGLPDAPGWQARGNELEYAEWPSYRRNYLLGLAGFALFALSGGAARRRTSARERASE